MADLLDGIRIIDLTAVLAGPFATYQLGLLGAEVIKVEPPYGDIAREFGADPELAKARMGASFLAQNAGKRSVTIDLKTDGGREVFERLIATSDVLVENMRPGVLSRLGFSWQRLRELNPQLVYCALSGFGSQGPLAGRQAYDQIIQGLSGMADVTGHPGRGPLRVGFPVCDTMGGLSAALAVCCGLIGRARNGHGCMVDVSMLDTALTGLGWIASDYLIAGHAPDRMGNHNATSAPSGTFRCADGELNIAANTAAQFESVCTALDRGELLRDPRFTTREDRKANRAALTNELEETLMRASTRHWETVLTSAGVPAGRVLTVPEAFAEDQITARGLLHPIAVPGVSGVSGADGERQLRVLGTGIHVDGQAPAPSRPPAQLGEHTDEVLREIGYDDAVIDQLRKAGAV